MTHCNVPPFTIPGHPCLPNVLALDNAASVLTRQMMRNGMEVSLERLHDLSVRIDKDQAELKSRILDEHVPVDLLEGFTQFNIDSPDQTAQLLFDYLNLGRGMDLVRTPSGSRLSTGKGQLEALRDEHPVVPLILDYRQLAKLRTTYVEKLPRMVRWHPQGKDCPLCGHTHWDRPSPRIHTQIVGTRTSTSRYASRSPNLQQIPSRSEIGQLVRACFVAGVGCLLAMDDYSQIELRLLAHLSKAASMIQVFNEGGDIHTYTACRMFNKKPEEIDQIQERKPAKQIAFGLVYGETALGLQAQVAKESGLIWSVEKCEKFIQDWFGVYPEIEAYIDEQHFRARKYQFVWDMFGGIRRIPGIRSVHEKVRSRALREAGNDEIQASAAGVMKLALVLLSRHEGLARAYGAAPLMTIHDEVIHEVWEDKAEDWEYWTRVAMESVVDLRVPVVCDGKVAPQWEK